MSREADALHRLMATGRSGPFRLLGQGHEAVVFTDEKRVFKVFDRWPSPDEGPTPEDLLADLGNDEDWQTLYRIEVEWPTPDRPLFSYRYEPSEPYDGGRLEDLARLILECRRAGLVMSNLHPDNVIVTGQGVKLIDYGVSLEPWTEEGELHMARRAWLMARCHARPDLKSLMRAALKDSRLPELLGFDEFLARLAPEGRQASLEALGPTSEGRRPLGQEATLDPRIVAITLETKPQRVLDYGCGKGKICETLATNGVNVTGWDPDPDRRERCRSYGSAVRYVETLDELQGEDETFDVVICSLVACIVPETGVDAVLEDLRRFVKAEGRVIFSICHPFMTLSGASEIHRKTAPEGARYRSRFELASVSRYTGRSIRDLHRPWAWYVRRLAESGLSVEATEETEGLSPETGCPHPDYLIATLRPRPTPVPGVSLIIRACALEADTMDAQVRHLVHQLGGSTPLQQRIVAVDPRREGFPRGHGQPDRDALLKTLQELVSEGLVDEILVGPERPSEIQALNERWFGLSTPADRAANGQAVATALSAFERCRHATVVAVDADIMIHRKPGRDPVGEAIAALSADPRCVTASLNITRRRPRSWTSESEAGPWRVEVRAAVFHRDRLLGLRPLPNTVAGDRLELPWHRALDCRISESGLHSLRGGEPDSGFIHPPNCLKIPRDDWLDVLDRVEAGVLPKAQAGQVELTATGRIWNAPKRPEPYVFVICGRNVEAGRLRRCLISLCRQRGPLWGAIVIDDASDNGAAEDLEMLCAPLQERVTLIRNRSRRGTLANLHRAIHEFMSDPDTVVLTLDADDALLGPGVLERVAREYETGADVTVGSMRRTDKDRSYQVDLADPRGRRGGNVWQHLRSFRRRLFQAIDVEDLKLDGRWIEEANDWAFMIPIVEMARSPVHIPEPLYLYDPSPDKLRRSERREAREKAIARILAKPSYGPDGRPQPTPRETQP